MGRLHESLLQWKINNYEVFVCARARASVGDFQKNVIEDKICVLILSTTFLSNISNSSKNLEKILS
jgi:hypothetical protein